MKKYSHIVVFVFLILGKLSYCDVIIVGSHAVTKCAKITNLNDYPEVSLIGFKLSVFNYYHSYIVVPAKCLECDSESSLNIYAINKTLLIGYDIEKNDWRKDKNALKSNIYINTHKYYVDDSIPIYSIEQFYKILGFTDTTIVLFKWKEVTNDKNMNLLATDEFTYDGDISILSQKFPLGIKTITYHSTFTLYPNPAKQVVSMKISNFYQGSVPVEIFSFGGKVLKSTTLIKTGFIYDSTISIENLPKGIYFVTLRFGAMVETQKLIIN
jgi:hypothetical protein